MIWGLVNGSGMPWSLSGRLVTVTCTFLASEASAAWPLVPMHAALDNLLWCSSSNTTYTLTSPGPGGPGHAHARLPDPRLPVHPDARVATEGHQAPLRARWKPAQSPLLSQTESHSPC